MFTAQFTWFYDRLRFSEKVFVLFQTFSLNLTYIPVYIYQYTYIYINKSQQIYKTSAFFLCVLYQSTIYIHTCIFQKSECWTRHADSVWMVTACPRHHHHLLLVPGRGHLLLVPGRGRPVLVLGLGRPRPGRRLLPYNRGGWTRSNSCGSQCA